MRRFLPRPWRIPVTLSVIAASAAIFLGAKPPAAANSLDEQIAQIVAVILEHKHLAKPELNDEVSKLWCRNYIKTFDPQKMYFLKGDVDAFLKSETTLDDAVKKGDLAFMKQVFDVFSRRHDERQKEIVELISKDYDFTVDESLVDDAKKLEYPADAAEAKERWRKLIKYEFLLAKIDNEDIKETRKKLTVRYRDRNRNIHQLDNSDLLELYLSAMTTAIDPHSRYLSAKTYEDMVNQDLHLSLEGIGARLRSEDGYAVIEEVVAGGPADKDGRLKPEDKIVGIVLDNGEQVDFVEKKLNDVVRYIRGKRGTTARLKVLTANSTKPVVYDLVRDKVELKDSHAQSQIIKTKGKNGQDYKLGMIVLPTFYGDTMSIMRGEPDAVSATKDCEAMLKQFKAEAVDAVVIDLRGNPGGLLTEAETLSGLFIKQGPVVQVRNEGELVTRKDDDPAIAWEGPLAVIIDKTSASASEIFAGVIQDYGRGIVVGDSSTFGKGTVQQLFPINEMLRQRNLPELGAIKLTIQQFYRANGASTQIQGVRPDIHIPSVLDQSDFGEGKTENALPFDKIAALPHDLFDRVNTGLVSQLNKLSEERRSSNKDFQKLNERIKKYVERKKSDTIPLNEAKYRAEYLAQEDEKEREKEKEKEKERKGGHRSARAWEPGFYNDEVTSIVSDYLELGGKLFKSPVRSAQR